MIIGPLSAGTPEVPRINYLDASGQEHQIEVATGRSVMEGAFNHGLPGMLADCGGSCSCGTCRVRIAEDWRARIGPAGDLEAAVLDLDDEELIGMRLACQIKVTPELDGLTVRLPSAE